MTETFILSIGKQAITTAVTIAGPILIVSLVIGLIISIFQAATQIQEQTLTFVPKMIAIIAVLLILGPWIMNTMINFTQEMLQNIIYVVR